jgi:hypothetical protein
MKRKEENRSVIEPSCTFFKPNKVNFLPSNQVLDRKPDRVTIILSPSGFRREHCGVIYKNFLSCKVYLLYITGEMVEQQ